MAGPFTTVTGLLDCDNCGPEEKTINILEAHNDIARFITISYYTLNQRPPKYFWKKVDMGLHCTRCGVRNLSVPRSLVNNEVVNFPFLYLLEALGSLKKSHLSYYCRQNHLTPKTDKDDLLYQVYYHFGTQFEGGGLRPAAPAPDAAPAVPDAAPGL